MTPADLIAAHEGLRLTGYLDTDGSMTIGYGQHLDALTVAQRVWLTHSHGSVANAIKGITFAEAQQLLDERVAELMTWACEEFGDWFKAFTQTRQAVILDMAYEMGETGLLGFSRFLAHCAAGDFQLAIAEMKNSRWAAQVPAREQNDALLLAQG